MLAEVHLALSIDTDSLLSIISSLFNDLHGNCRIEYCLVCCSLEIQKTEITVEMTSTYTAAKMKKKKREKGREIFLLLLLEYCT